MFSAVEGWILFVTGVHDCMFSAVEGWIFFITGVHGVCFQLWRIGNCLSLVFMMYVFSCGGLDIVRHWCS